MNSMCYVRPPRVEGGSLCARAASFAAWGDESRCADPTVAECAAGAYSKGKVAAIIRLAVTRDWPPKERP